MGKRTIAGVTFESEWYDAVKEPMSEPMYSEQDMEAKDREIERLRAELAKYKLKLNKKFAYWCNRITQPVEIRAQTIHVEREENPITVLKEVGLDSVPKS